MLRHLPASLRRIVIAACISMFIAALIPAPFAMAQTTGTLTGQVFNEQNQPLSRVKITIVNEDSGNEYATVTDGSGSYRRPLLPPGNYRIIATLANYGPGAATVRVPLNATTEIKPPLITLRSLAPTTPTQTTPTQTTPGQPPTGQTTGTAPAGTSVPAPESSSLINKVDPTRGGNFTERELEALPLGGGATMRSFDELALLVPGVLPPPYTPGVRGPGVGFGIGTAGQFSVNGLRARSNNFTIDGSDNNDPDVGVRRQGFVALVPQPIESVQEFQIATLLWNAEQGRNFGSQVNAVSKGGTAAIHGQAYGFFTHNSLNARNAFDFLGGASEGEDPFTRLQAGAVIGGPIGKMKKTQWFASYEFLNINSSVEQHFAVPALASRRFLNATDLDIVATGTDGAGNTIPLFFRSFGGASPVGQNVFSLYPTPNNTGGPFGDSNYTAILPADGDGSIASFRLTHQLTPNNTFNGRYNFTDDDRTLPSVNRAIRSSIIADSRTQNLSLILDSALNLNLFNQARFSYGRTRLDFPAFSGNRFNPCSASPNQFSRSIPDDPLVFCNDNFVSSLAPIDASGQLGSPFGLRTETGPLGQVTLAPFDPLGVDVSTFPARRVNNTFQFADTMSWTYLTHSFKFGADVRRYQLNSQQDRNYRPSLVFTNGIFVNASVSDQGFEFDDTPFIDTLRGTSFAALGFPSAFFQTITLGPANSNIGLRFTEYNLFFNDNVRLTPKLTLDYGLRYEYNSVPHEVNDRIENALALQNLPPSTNPDPTNPGNKAFLDAFDRSVAAYKQVLGGRTGIYSPDRDNLAPHIGFAWAPNLRTSIRSGYGIYYDAILGAVVSQSRNVFPNEIPITIDPAFLQGSPFDLRNPFFLIFRGDPNNRLIRQGTLNEFGLPPELVAVGIGALFAQGAGGAGGLSFILPERKLRTPYAQHWHLTVEHEIWRDYLISAAYVGTKGTKLTRLTTPNLGPNSIPTGLLLNAGDSQPLLFDPLTAGLFLGFNSTAIAPDRPNSNLGPYQIFENSANSNYHALQFEARKRYSNGYTFTAAYTWSHAIDEVSDVFPIAGAPILPQDSRNLSAERASANFDVRHRFVTSLVWDLPFYRGLTGGAADVLGGWQITTIFQAHTGQPFTLNLPFDANLDGNLTDRPSTTNGLIFFDGHGSQRVAVASDNTFVNFLNTTGGLRVNEATGQLEPFLNPGTGFVGRNTLRGDGFINLDVALGKSFRFNENQSLLFRTEVFNVLNRTNYGLPIRTIGAPGFGSSIDTVNPARIIQFALKYSF